MKGDSPVVSAQWVMRVFPVWKGHSMTRKPLIVGDALHRACAAALAGNQGLIHRLGNIQTKDKHTLQHENKSCTFRVNCTTLHLMK
jgi:hypothetical protein